MSSIISNSDLAAHQAYLEKHYTSDQTWLLNKLNKHNLQITPLPAAKDILFSFKRRRLSSEPVADALLVSRETNIYMIPTERYGVFLRSSTSILNGVKAVRISKFSSDVGNFSSELDIWVYIKWYLQATDVAYECD